MNQDHSLHQSDLPVKLQILNISVNMARMGELVLKFGEAKLPLVKKFLEQTDSYLKDLKPLIVAGPFKETLDKFSQEFEKLKKQDIAENKALWAERAVTWGDILQIRSGLVQ